jgi:hypothetical protein
MAPPTYGKTRWRGRYACGCMILSIERIIEPRLRRAGFLRPGQWVTAFQYAYSTSTSLSANTHAKGGALDHGKGNDAQTRIWRECGVADWQRGSPHDPYFSDHNHGIWIGCPHLDPTAARQVTAYRNGRNGLANNGPDKSPRVTPITWQAAYDKYIKEFGDGIDLGGGSADKEGILGMTEIDKPHRSIDQTITDNGDWQTLRINDDGGWSLLTGPCKGYVAVTAWEIKGMEVGDVAQFRYVIVNDDVSPANKPTTIEYRYPVVESIGTSGSTFGQMTWLNDIGGDKAKDVKRRLRVVCKPPAGKTITIADLTSRVMH